MTLWDAYQIANKRRAGFEVREVETGYVYRVPTHRSHNGLICADVPTVPGGFVAYPPEQAKTIEVEQS